MLSNKCLCSQLYSHFTCIFGSGPSTFPEEDRTCHSFGAATSLPRRLQAPGLRGQRSHFTKQAQAGAPRRQGRLRAAHTAASLSSSTAIS